MIRAFYIVNNSGKARVLKYYDKLGSVAEEQQVLRKCFHLIAQRPDTFCNYLTTAKFPMWAGPTKLIYRHYATLYFILAVDESESDLGILDLIQVFVEVLDRLFENVCELDLIFHSDQVLYVLDEIIQGGIVIETGIAAILDAVNAQNKKVRPFLRVAPSRAERGRKRAVEPASAALHGRRPVTAPSP